MDIESFASRLASFLAPFLGYLLKRKKYEGTEGDHDDHAWETAKALWSKLSPGIKHKPALQEVLQDTALSPYNEDALGSLRLQLKKLLSHDETLAKDLSSIWEEAIPEEERDRTISSPGDMKGRVNLDSYGEMLSRLEMIRLLRSGSMPPEKIAEQFGTDTEYLYRLNAAYSLNSLHGILSSEPKNWLDGLSTKDPILRRLEMIRLIRSGTPPSVVAREFGALTEYIQRINERFSRNGVIGILTEDDFRKFRSEYPEVIRVCTFNLHGVQENNGYRLKRIAREMSGLDPSLCAFQEVISGRGIPETSAEIAGWMTRMTGSLYQTQFAYCHLFMEKYPEGVSISSRYQFSNVHTIDLNKGLEKNLHPLMERYASAAEVEIYGRKIVFVSVHLDHAENQGIRHAQARKLLNELKRLYGEKDYYCFILAGDFNDLEDSPVMTFLKREGYRDAYRECNAGGGDTFTSSNPHKRIDYIMVKGDVRFLSAELVLDNSGLSDHIGVFSVIK